MKSIEQLKQELQAARRALHEAQVKAFKDAQAARQRTDNPLQF